MRIIFFILSAAALFNLHVARGDGCQANVDGQSATLKEGDNYCADETTSKTCLADGTFKTDQCPPPSKCLKSPGQFKTLCREIRRNVDSNNGNNNQAPPPSQPNQPNQPNQPDQTPPKKESPPTPKDDKSPQADQSPQAAPADKPETCTATIDGQQQTLQTGDRYCSSETTSRVCSYGEWVDFQCEDGSKCLKQKDAWRVLCRKVVKNAPQATPPQDSEAQPAEKPKLLRRKRDHDKAEAKAEAKADAKPNAPPQSDQAPQAAPSAGDKPETCTATIDGQQQTLQTGDRYCSSETTSRVCSYGEWVDFQCDEGSKCLKQKDAWRVLCRKVIRNPPQASPPQDSEAQPADKSSPKRK